MRKMSGNVFGAAGLSGKELWEIARLSKKYHIDRESFSYTKQNLRAISKRGAETAVVASENRTKSMVQKAGG